MLANLSDDSRLATPVEEEEGFTDNESALDAQELEQSEHVTPSASGSTLRPALPSIIPPSEQSPLLQKTHHPDPLVDET